MNRIESVASCTKIVCILSFDVIKTKQKMCNKMPQVNQFNAGEAAALLLLSHIKIEKSLLSIREGLDRLELIQQVMIVINDNYKSAILLRRRRFCSLLYHVEPLTLREQRRFDLPSMRRSFYSELALPQQSSSNLNSGRPCNHKVPTLFMAQWVSSMDGFTPGATETRTDTTSCLWQLKEIDGFCQPHLTQPHKCSNKWADKEFSFLSFWRRVSHPLLTTC